MRALLGLCCSLTLAVALAAQNPPTSSTDSGQQQQQQNPLQEAPKPADQPQKPSASTFELGGAASAGKDQELGEVRLMTRYTQLHGDQTKSFLVPGENDVNKRRAAWKRSLFQTARKPCPVS